MKKIFYDIFLTLQGKFYSSCKCQRSAEFAEEPIKYSKFSELNCAQYRIFAAKGVFNGLFFRIQDE